MGTGWIQAKPRGHAAHRLALIPTFVVVAVDATGMGIILPLLPFYSQRLGATPFVVGALISVYSLCQLVAGPVVGMLSDRYGRRSVLIVSQVGRWPASCCSHRPAI